MKYDNFTPHLSLDDAPKADYHKDKAAPNRTSTTEQGSISDAAAPNQTRRKDKRKRYRVTVGVSESPCSDAELYRSIYESIRTLTASEQRKG